MLPRLEEVAKAFSLCVFLMSKFFLREYWLPMCLQRWPCMSSTPSLLESKCYTVNIHLAFSLYVQ